MCSHSPALTFPTLLGLFCILLLNWSQFQLQSVQKAPRSSLCTDSDEKLLDKSAKEFISWILLVPLVRLHPGYAIKFARVSSGRTIEATKMTYTNPWRNLGLEGFSNLAESS